MAGSSKSVLFAISDTGGGHRSAAQAIIAALRKRGDHKCDIVDLLRATNVPGLKQAPEIYDYCSRHHLWLNNFFFLRTNSVSSIANMTAMVDLRARPYIDRELTLAQPDMAVSVHPLVTGLLCKARDRLRMSWPIITVVTDLVTLHASWATPGADLYLAPTDNAVQALKKFGVPAAKIVLSGFPVHPKFGYQPDRQQYRQELGIAPDRFTILLTGGGVGAGNMLDWVTVLQARCSHCQLIVVTGNNKTLYAKLNATNPPADRLKVLGFADNMEKLMAASDIVITKAGPGTIMEAVTVGRPLIVTGAVGIQESGNINYVCQNNLGYYCATPAAACRRILEITAGETAGFARENKHVPISGAADIADIILGNAPHAA